MTVKLCDRSAVLAGNGGLCLIDSISRKTTPEEFDQRRKHFPKYRLEDANQDGYTALAAAAMYGNVALIEHIARKELLNLGNNWGWTALFLAVRRGNNRAVEKLLELGADPNIASSEYGQMEFHHPDYGLINRELYLPGTTPLWITAQREDKISSKILLQAGASETVCPRPEGCEKSWCKNLDEKRQKWLKDLRGELKKEREAILFEVETVTQLPAVLVNQLQII